MTATAWIKTGAFSQASVHEVTLTAGDDSQWLSLLAMRDRCLQIEGVPSGATIIVEGTNQIDPGASGAAPLANAAARPIKATDGGAVAALGMFQLLDTPAFLRVRTVGGDGSTAVTFSLNAGRTQ